MSNLQHAIWTLRQFNLWRRSDEDMDQPDPREIGKAIDDAIEAMEELNEWRTLMSWGGTPEIINEFIKGQQSRIYAVQEAEEQRDRLAEELDALKQSILDLSHPNMKLLLEERNEAREQRDRLAEAIRKHRDELELTSGDSVDRILWNTLVIVKGGNNE